jgi:hypothetical protein
MLSLETERYHISHGECESQTFEQYWPDVTDTGRALRKIALLLGAKLYSLNSMMRVTILLESLGRCCLILSAAA